MRVRIVVLAVVAAAVAGIVWFKQTRASSVAAPSGARTTVLLFADLREADDTCGCGDVIRLARKTDGLSGVAYHEFDARQQADAARQYGVRTLPTVLVLGADGAERKRFEGESKQVIGQLRSALASLDGAKTTTQP